MAIKTRKKPMGIALRPDLWERIDAAAEELGQSRNAVMESVLLERFPAASHSQNSDGLCEHCSREATR
jgi:predicted transcriptional regulator